MGGAEEGAATHLQQDHLGQQAVPGGGHGGPLGVLLAGALGAVSLQLDRLQATSEPGAG